MTETDALKQRNFANKVTSNVRRGSLFVAIDKPVINFSAVFENEHGVSLFAARIVDIVEGMVSSDFLFRISPRTYQRYIQVAKFFI